MTRPISSFVSDRSEPDHSIVFSLRDGFVWASWPDTEAAVRLGQHSTVASSMEDFLAQDALGARLAARRYGEE